MLSKLPFTALLAGPSGHVIARATIDTSNCTKITPECPLEYTTYGYYPNLGGNVFFLLFFLSLFVAQVYLGMRCKTWSYTAALATGTLFEALGYVGRLMLHQNPWSSGGFIIQMLFLIVGPCFVAAAIYLTLKHFIIYCGPEHSPLKPNYYPWIFVGCDAGSIVIQAVGGGVASAGTGGGKDSVAELGNHIMVAGIVFQVVTMGLCGCLLAFYIFRYQRRHLRRKQGTSQYETSKANGTVSRQKLKTFAIVLTIAYFLVLIRCIYRIPELAGGWGNHLMRIEKEFLVLDGMMIALATLILTVFWPSYYFPPFATFRVDKHLPLVSENIAL
ncbi:parasitic phase-specific PSP-1 [Fusarium mexicanum]|uniref:Parasitic phase-specific PSP-1 n=2 Tax=Fusarium fujikuroi species complex TaxID=171627 RepID=A0A8H5IV47_9HYPO|nr:parasitic phase-specific PSP-1 [Fusarium mexicanum]